jgi:succinoglycan biosynthesis protein ExoA
MGRPMTSSEHPTVTIAIPVLNEEAHLGACLDSVEAQTYPNIIEVLVVDGGSSDATAGIATSRPNVRLLDNPRRVQAAALNIALGESKGSVFVRVDGHCELAPDYVECCVSALAETGAAMVGGPMRPSAEGWKQRGIAAAMSSRWGAGPAKFHVGSSASGWTDTVYLGAFRTTDSRDAGGYSEDVGVNEDAELAIRLARFGGVWLDERIRSTYIPRTSFSALARQFYRYGASRAATVRRHPESLAARQLAAPALVVGLLCPWRRNVVMAYAAVIVVATVDVARREGAGAAAFGPSLPVMHVAWAAGFFRGLCR